MSFVIDILFALIAHVTAVAAGYRPSVENHVNSKLAFSSLLQKTGIPVLNFMPSLIWFKHLLIEGKKHAHKPCNIAFISHIDLALHLCARRHTGSDIDRESIVRFGAQCNLFHYAFGCHQRRQWYHQSQYCH